MVQVAVGNANNVYAVSAAGSVFKWSGANWSAVQTPNTNIKQVAVTGDGSKLAAIDKTGGIYVRTATTWATLSGALTASVGISNNYIVGTNTDQRIYYKQLTSDAGRFACKEVNNQVTCVSTNGDNPVLFETEAQCKAFVSDPGTAKWSITAAPSGPLASLVDNFVRARV